MSELPGFAGLVSGATGARVPGVEREIYLVCSVAGPAGSISWKTIPRRHGTMLIPTCLGLDVRRRPFRGYFGSVANETRRKVRVVSVDTLEQQREERGPRPAALAAAALSETALAERDSEANRQPWFHLPAETRQTSFPLVIEEASSPQFETLRILFSAAAARA